MIREVNLIGFLPEFVQEYREIRCIMDAENPSVQALEDETERIKDNQFIITCDLVGISRFENLLGITPSEDDTLESRISRVLVRWNDAIPYTWKVLIQKLNTLCGVGKYELIPEWDEYKLTIKTHMNLYGSTEELDNILDNIMPCNILVISQNEISHDVLGTGHHVGVVTTTKHFTIESKINQEHSINGVIGYGNNVTTTRHVTIL